MFRRLLVPLDGSPMAEAVFPAVRCLAETLTATAVLMHAVERKTPASIHGVPHLTTPERAETYLADAAKRIGVAASRMERHVHENQIDDVAPSIVDHTEELGIDLIVMCTHGSGGVRHGLFGTVAERVIALGTTPVLLVPMPHDDARPFSCKRLLVPLDGNTDHEQGLSAVKALGAREGTEVLLLMVIPTWGSLKQESLITSRMMPATTAELLEASLAAAPDYLEEKKHELAVLGCEVSASAVRGDPLRTLLVATNQFQADLMLLGTHGMTHTAAFWSGSLTPQLVHRSRIPTLLVPVRGEK